MTFISMSWMISLIFMLLKHPLSIGTLLFMQTILVALISGPFMMSFWYSYILFLIMIGGMLILFIYMTSIASNEKFKFSKTIFSVVISFSSINLLFMIIDPNLTLYFKKMEDLSLFSTKFTEFQITNKFIYLPMNLLFMIIISYLLISLIAVVKITDKPFGPLRQKFYVNTYT
uniref:NADH-ubiquinone oxidoreductase chain 6 n=1 Tax=Urodontus glabratus TaxID=1205599 RepID=A0A0S2MSK3_9CUCU|nr:NADH deshydrogenase subunit 6 [Urodontus glabratus]